MSARRDQPDINLGAVLRYIQTEQVPHYLNKTQRVALKKHVHNFKLQPDGKLYYMEKQSVFGKKVVRQVVIEISEQRKIVEASHVIDYDTRRHLDLEDTYKECSRNFYWPTQYHDVAQFVRNCSACSQRANGQQLPDDQQSQVSGRTKSSWTSFRPLPDTPTEERRKELARKAQGDGNHDNTYLQPGQRAAMLQRKAAQQQALRSNQGPAVFHAGSGNLYPMANGTGDPRRHDYQHQLPGNYRPSGRNDGYSRHLDDRHNAHSNHQQQQTQTQDNPTATAFSQPAAANPDPAPVANGHAGDARSKITANELLAAARGLNKTVGPQEKQAPGLVGRVLDESDGPPSAPPPPPPEPRRPSSPGLIDVNDIRRQARSLKKTGAIPERGDIPEPSSNRGSKLEELFNIKLSDEPKPGPSQSQPGTSHATAQGHQTSGGYNENHIPNRFERDVASPPPPPPAAPPPPVTSPPEADNTALPSYNSYIPKALQNTDYAPGQRKVSSSDDNERPSGVPARPRNAPITNQEFLKAERPAKKNPLFEGNARRGRREDRRRHTVREVRDSPTNSSTDSFYRRTPSADGRRGRRQSPSPDRYRQFQSEQQHRLRSPRRHTQRAPHEHARPQAQHFFSSRSHKLRGYYKQDMRRHRSPHPSTEEEQHAEERGTRRGRSPDRRHRRPSPRRARSPEPRTVRHRSLENRDPRMQLYPAGYAYNQHATSRRFHAAPLNAWGYHQGAPTGTVVSRAPQAYNRLWWQGPAMPQPVAMQQQQAYNGYPMAVADDNTQWGWSEQF